MITYEVFDSLLSLITAAVTAASLALGEAPPAPAQDAPVEVEQAQEVTLPEAPAITTPTAPTIIEEREGK